MKKIVLMSLISSLACASTAEIKKDKVLIELNGEKQLALEGDKITLNKNDTICILKGKGKVVIDGEIRISMKNRDKCYKNFNDSGSESLSSTVNSYLSSDEDTVSGMSRGIKQKDNK